MSTSHYFMPGDSKALWMPLVVALTPWPYWSCGDRRKSAAAESCTLRANYCTPSASGLPSLLLSANVGKALLEIRKQIFTLCGM